MVGRLAFMYVPFKEKWSYDVVWARQDGLYLQVSVLETVCRVTKVPLSRLMERNWVFL